MWQFTVMPFGLCNAPVTFELLMKSVLGGLAFEACLEYMDDRIVVGRTFQEQCNNLRNGSRCSKEPNSKGSPKCAKSYKRKPRT
jgi:hypothetical protein